MIKTFIASIPHAFRGLRSVWREEANFRIDIVCSLLVFVFAFYFSFSFEEWLAVICAVVLVLFAEILNTIIEDFWNVLHPDHHPIVGKIKDMMAGSVLLSSLFAILVGALVITHHFF